MLFRSGLERLFWEHDVSKLSWEADRDFVIGRVLSTGDWESIRWLLERLGRRELHRWIEERRGRPLDARRLRFWEVVLGIPHSRVSGWIAAGDPAWLGRTKQR